MKMLLRMSPPLLSILFNKMDIFLKKISSITMCDPKYERLKISNFAANTHNPIRRLVETLHIVPNPEKQLIALSIGDPTTFGNLKPPAEAVEAVQNCVASGDCDGYAPSAGYMMARQAVAKYSSINGLDVKAEDIVLCSGCSSAIDLCISVLANPGSNIIVPRPGFSIYATLAEGLGVTVRYYDLIPEKNWEANLQLLEDQIDCKTVCIVINNPSNPCGSVYSKFHLEQILSLARKYTLPIIADEIYEHLVFAGSEFYPIASLSKDVPVLSCSGLTKRFLVPGWRMGWIVIHDRNGILSNVRDGLNKLSQRVMGSNTIVQSALPAILFSTPQQFFNDTISVLHGHALLAYSRISKVPGLKPVMPQGAMYMMVGLVVAEFTDIVNSISFVEKLVAEESVFCLPGECFQCPNYVRLVLTAPENMLIAACDRIENFCHRHYRRESIKFDISARKGLRDREDPRCENSGREP